METPEERGKALWAFIRDPQYFSWHINWGSIPHLFIRSEQDAVDYYKRLDAESTPSAQHN